MTLILASGSAARRQMLESAGLTFVVERPPLDEEAAKESLRREKCCSRDQAEALAKLKALSVSRERSGFVIGADQILSVDGEALDKPKDMSEARAHLEKLRGRTHELITAVVLAKGESVIWRHVEIPRLKMRSFSDAFLQDYLESIGDSALHSVGAYQLEGLGAQLFDQVDGDYFSVLGLPLLPLLTFLRQHGLVRG